ncbi:Protein CBR-THOC-3.1 [Caenorhabditis briggsae]|uniref:Protein CBR-THOC-3.1 n=1 Tax=Caenorhabditis briggsae TaxID=6238 RepID=A8XFC9_CAEBR|nr:Protein CBR-THOC-3.1 [Caenorhabditis briggsae]CAP31390.2 Protein CBR-THOC-3.1 [Caenorhabditis briggsae]
MFASASSDRNVCIWDARQSKPTHRITNKVGNFFVSWSPCDEYLIFLDKDNRVNTVDVRNYKVVNTHDMKVFSHEVIFHPLSNHVFVAESGGRVEVLKFVGGALEPATVIQHIHIKLTAWLFRFPKTDKNLLLEHPMHRVQYGTLMN